jgi:hypothetical protein
MARTLHNSILGLAISPLNAADQMNGSYFPGLRKASANFISDGAITRRYPRRWIG